MEEIGRRLQAAREAKGISLQVVEEETKIRRKYIEALEAGRETDLPGAAYLKGFLRTYGNYLGLDGTALVDQYKQLHEARDQTEAKVHAGVAQGPAGAAPAPEVKSPEAERPAVRPGRTEEPAARPARPRPHESARRSAPAAGTGGTRFPVVALVAVLLLAAVGYLGWQIFRPGPEPEAQPPANPTPSPVVEKQPDPTPPVVVPDPPKVTMTRGTGSDVIFTVPGKAIEVRIEPGPDRVWTRATADGATTFTDATLTAPTEFKANQTLTIRMGHMQNISLVVNGQRFEKPLDNKSYTLIFNRQQ